MLMVDAREEKEEGRYFEEIVGHFSTDRDPALVEPGGEQAQKRANNIAGYWHAKLEQCVIAQS